MNGEIPSVPITTLAGVASLTNLLPELPIPTPLPNTTNNRNIIYSRRLVEEVRKTLNSSDQALVSQLVDALRRASTEHIQLNDSTDGSHVDVQNPSLLQAIFAEDPQILRSFINATHADDVALEDDDIRLLEENLADTPFVNGIGSPGDIVNDILPTNGPPDGGHFQSAFLQFMQQQYTSDHNSQGPKQQYSGQDAIPCSESSRGSCSLDGPVKEEVLKEVEQTPVKVDAKLEHAADNSNPFQQFPKSKYNDTPAPVLPGKSSNKASKRKLTNQTPPVQLTVEDAASPFSSLGDRVKRRRNKAVTYREDSDEERHSTSSKGSKKRDLKLEDGPYIPQFPDGFNKGCKVVLSKLDASPKPAPDKKPRRPNNVQKGPVIVLQDCMEFAPTQKQFLHSIEDILENAQQMDLIDLNLDEEDEMMGVPSDAVISRQQLSKVCSEAAKLNSTGYMNLIPTEKLVKLLTILQFSIRDGLKAIPAAVDDDETEENEEFRDIVVSKILAAVDASLVSMYVMTAKEMPKEVFIEEVIDKVVNVIKIQLKGTIFPEFDPVYRVKPNDTTNYQGNVKAKRARSSGAKNRSVLLIYNKISELIELIAQVVNVQELTDGIVLQASSLAVAPFFVENVSELQLNCLKLVTSIFTRYEKHRQLIIEDILASLARLPSSKKNLRSYRLNSDEYIQMVTALTMQLIQSVVVMPSNLEDRDDGADPEVLIMNSYSQAMRTAHSFLSVFLTKCTSKNEDDYRPLFENFVRDLLSTVNKPEWPASEVVLSLLGRLLVQQFNNKSADMSLRVASLDYLGIVAARLHRDDVNSKLNESVIDDIIRRVKDKDGESQSYATTETADLGNNTSDKNVDSGGDVKKPGDESVVPKDNSNKTKKPERRKTRRSSSNSTISEHSTKEVKQEEEEAGATSAKKPVQEESAKLQTLQECLLEYLTYHSESDPALLFARKFYWGQWYRDCSMEVDKTGKAATKCRSGRQTEDAVAELEKVKAQQEIAQKRKAGLQQLLKAKSGLFAAFKPSPSRLDYQSACLVTQYLASKRPFAQSFEIYLTQILKVLCETAVAVRTRAMKSLTLVVDVDPAILIRPDMQTGVHGRLLDHSTSVREAAVELIGNFILGRPELVSQYYEMLSERILDTGISVRKRVIKIFRDICLEMPEFEKIPEMCVKMIRRVNDEEGIKKLVNDTFQNMWFVPLPHHEISKMVTRVMNITDVVAACKNTGMEWFEHLLDNLLKKEEGAKDQPVERSCVQLIECLIEHVLKLESHTDMGGQGSCSPRLVSCIGTLYLFCKIKPQLMTKHCATLQPYMDIRCTAPSDHVVVFHVAKILELAVPLIKNPNDNFLAQLEEDMMKLILKYGQTVLQSCVSCLGAVVNEVTKNYKLVKDCFHKFYAILSKFMVLHKRNPENGVPQAAIPSLLRALYTMGLLCRHFDFDAKEFGEWKAPVKDTVFEVLMYFVHHEWEPVRLKALTGIGFFVTRHYEFMLGAQLRDLYQDYMCSKDAPQEMRCQVLRNLNAYLVEEEVRMMKAEDDWKKQHNKEDLKEMGDVQSGMASTIIQVYLKPVLESFFHHQPSVRMTALSVICLVLKQGLVHPVQIVPYLICLGSDNDLSVKVKADQQLQEMDKKYPGFIQMKALQGVKMSYRLQEVLHSQRPNESLRGLRNVENDTLALNSFIYSLIRSQRSQRRSLAVSMLNLFDDSLKVSLKQLIFIADNVATFPYQYQDEPLFAIHHIDVLVSVYGSNVLQSYKEIFYENASGEIKKYDEDEEDFDYLVSKVPDDVSELNKLYLTTQNCILLLMLKNHLKDLFGFTEVKMERYSPGDSVKVWDKPLTRKRGADFNPKPVLDLVNRLPLPTTLDEDGKRQLVQDYIEFKELMMSIDPCNDDDDDEVAKPEAPDPPPNHVKENEDSKSAAVKQDNQEINNLSGDNHDITVINDEDQEELKAKNMSTPLTSSKSSYNKLLSLVSSSSKKQKESPASRSKKSHSSHHKVHKHKKKKKKKKRYSDSNVSDSDDSSDPDFSL